MSGKRYIAATRVLSGVIAGGLLAWTTISQLQSDRIPLIALASFFLLLICFTATLNSRIPNLFTFSLAICGLAYHFWLDGFAGLGMAALGLTVGFSLLIIPYAMGGMGAGDVKCLAALGALLGPAAIFQVFLYMGLAGGVLAILHYLLESNLREEIVAWGKRIGMSICVRDPRMMAPARSGAKLRFPYAAAIIFGFCAFEQWGGLI